MWKVSSRPPLTRAIHRIYEQENVATSFCHFVHFFSSKATGEAWTAQNDGTFPLTLDEAFEVARKVNAARYATVL